MFSLMGAKFLGVFESFSFSCIEDWWGKNVVSVFARVNWAHATSYCDEVNMPSCIYLIICGSHLESNISAEDYVCTHVLIPMVEIF